MAPKVTRDRMYLDTLQAVYENVNNVVVATGDNTPMMYLPMGQSGYQPAVLPAPPAKETIKTPSMDESKEDEFSIPKAAETKRLTR
ncbi:MAG: hypothetical protein CSA45_06630 [Gammaproteobacteria bacterium]|nr:MAG: hypothetical protein CSA45_06630 [Gammaproteobacteria bacterium]